MPLIQPMEWVPVGVESLESVAFEVVRSMENTLVVAGPGAGKTELLAQRACYLLDTGICPSPKRILAISFKRDAAKNLGDRVRKRGKERAERFDSFTLDAFAKGLIDRFRPALPNEWRPKPGYEVNVGFLDIQAIEEWLIEIGVSENKIRGMTNEQTRKLLDRISHGFKLPYTDTNIDNRFRVSGLHWWKEQLDLPEGAPSLSFPMLNRLAAFLLRCNPKITAALRATYGFVFLDEFQDTTESQYDLIHSAFQGASAHLTAVGDSKQRIMLWAGAMSKVFDEYEKDFDAAEKQLTMNYRSSPELVRMQQVIAEAVEKGTPITQAAKTETGGNCVVFEFSTPESEAQYLASLIQEGIGEGRKPRDYCILVRQRTADMIQSLQQELSQHGIKLRDESRLQDLFSEVVVLFVVAVLRLSTRPRDAEAWDTLTNEISNLFGLDEIEDALKIEKDAQKLVENVKNILQGSFDIEKLPMEIVNSIGGENAFKSVYRQYGRGDYLKGVISDLAGALKDSKEATDTTCEMVDDLIGENAVPAMTIHKSKGLEFHTVIFLGLEDSQWWSFRNQPDEEKRGFFVAFSRAIENVYFTYSDVRVAPWGRQQQRRSNIESLYDILKTAGVQTVRPQ